MFIKRLWLAGPEELPMGLQTTYADRFALLKVYRRSVEKELAQAQRVRLIGPQDPMLRIERSVHAAMKSITEAAWAAYRDVLTYQ
jgi:hypothetical protein